MNDLKGVDAFVRQINKTKDDVRQDIKHRVASDPDVSADFTRHKTMAVLDDVLTAKPSSGGDARDLNERNLPAKIVWISRVPGGYRAVLVGARYNPESVEGDIEEISKLFKSIPDITSQLLRSDDIYIENERKTRDPIILEDSFSIPNLLVDDGEYFVMAKDDSMYRGFLFNNVVDLSGRIVGARLWTDGIRFAFQDGIVGDEARDSMPTKIAAEPAEGEWGTYGYMDGDEFKILLPFKVKTIVPGPRLMMRCHTIFGNSISLIISPNVSRIVSATGIKNEELGELLNAAIYYVPAAYSFFGLGTQRIDLLSNPEELRRRQIKMYLAREPSAQAISGPTCQRSEYLGTSTQNNFIVRFSGDGFYSMEGPILESIATRVVNEVPGNRAIWLLMNLGFSEGGARYILNRAQAIHKVNVAGAVEPKI